MTVFKKIGSFFAAMVPFWVFFVMQFIFGILGILAAAAVEIMASESIRKTITNKSAMLISIIVFVVCLLAAFFEMKLHGFHFCDLSPIRQNKIMYALSVVFAAAVFFIIKNAEVLYLKMTGSAKTGVAGQVSDVAILVALFALLLEALTEEYVFRGLLVKTFEKRFPGWVGAVFITLAFMLYRIDCVLIYALLLGAMLTVVRYLFGDLKLCVLVHFVVYILEIAMTYVNAETYQTVLRTGGIAGLIIACLTMTLMIKFATKKEPVLDTE